MFLQKETSHYKNSLALDPQGPKQYIFSDQFYSKNAKKLRFHYSFDFMLENMWHHHFTRSEPNSQEIVNFVLIVGPRGPELNWNKFDPLQVKWWYHVFSSIKMEEYMEPELSGIFWVKMVVKNIVLGSPGTHSMHMKVKG